jgi:hypothetical protein
MAGTLEVLAKNAMANGIRDGATLTLQAWDATTLISSASVTFGNANSGVLDITTATGGGGDVTLPIGVSTEVITVRLYSASNKWASETVSYTFTNGGNLVIESYAITVS